MCTHGSAEPHQGAHPCPAFDLVMPGRRLTLRVDAELHQKEKKNLPFWALISQVLFQYKLMAHLRWQAFEFNFQTKGKLSREN